MMGVEQVFDAVGLGQKFAAIEGVDINLRRRGLVAADEMAGQADAGDGQPEPPPDQQVNGAEADGIAGALVDDAVEKTVLRIVVVGLVRLELQFLKEVVVDGADDLLDVGGEINAGAEHGRKSIQQRLVGGHVDLGMLRLREPPRAFLQRQVLAPAGAVAEKTFVRRLASEEPDDFPRAPAQQRLVAQGGGSQPFRRLGAEGDEFGPHCLVHRCVLVREKADEGGALAFGKPRGGFCWRERVHVLRAQEHPSRV